MVRIIIVCLYIIIYYLYNQFLESCNTYIVKYNWVVINLFKNNKLIVFVTHFPELWSLNVPVLEISIALRLRVMWPKESCQFQLWIISILKAFPLLTSSPHLVATLWIRCSKREVVPRKQLLIEDHFIVILKFQRQIPTRNRPFLWQGWK